jgi:hypothetical protein
MVESKAISKEEFQGSSNWREILDATYWVLKLIITSKMIKDITFFNRLNKNN